MQKQKPVETIEDKLNELFNEYFPKGTATANDRKDDDKALLLTQVMEYRHNKFKQEIQAIITTETTKKALDELIELDAKTESNMDGSVTLDAKYLHARVAALQKEQHD